jgi:hypothetical protein
MIFIQALLLLIAAPPFARAGSYEASGTDADGRKIEYLEDKNAELKDAVADPIKDNQDVHAMARRLFERIPDKHTTDMPPIALRGWQKPDTRSEGTVDGLMHAAHKGLRISDVPPPTEVVDAYDYAEAMRKKGLMEYDQKEVLKRGMVGAYVYGEDAAIAILFSRAMREIQQWLGDEIASLVAIHEGAHTRDHQMTGELNPIEVCKGERLAFKTEYLMYKVFDPTGQKLSWARASFGKFAPPNRQAPEATVKFLEHVAQIVDYGDRGDFEGLVKSLGYKDRESNPFHPQVEPPSA